MVQRPMRSLLEVREHLGGDRIPCLICGKPFRAVCHHARLAHGISARDYKLRFGLPVSQSVAVPQAREAWGAAIRKTREGGRITDGAPPGGHHPQPVYATRDMRRIDPESINAVLRHVYMGCTLTEACAKPGMPRWTWLHAQMTRDDTLRARVDAVIESLPFAQQARMKKLGKRFAAAVAARASLTALAIAKELGVSEEAVRRQIKRNAHVQPPESR
jgi:hypothetical protein